LNEDSPGTSPSEKTQGGQKKQEGQKKTKGERAEAMMMAVKILAQNKYISFSPKRKDL